MVGMSGRFGAGHCRQVLAVVTGHTWMAAKGWDFPLEGDKYHPNPQPVWNEAQTVSWTFFCCVLDNLSVSSGGVGPSSGLPVCLLSKRGTRDPEAAWAGSQVP